MARATVQVQFNSWAYGTGIDNATMSAALATATVLGLEAFVLDFGWIDTLPDGTPCIGNWFPDKTKFPEGLLPLSKAAHAAGMLFGVHMALPQVLSAPFHCGVHTAAYPLIRARHGVTAGKRELGRCATTPTVAGTGLGPGCVISLRVLAQVECVCLKVHRRCCRQTTSEPQGCACASLKRATG